MGNRPHVREVCVGLQVLQRRCQLDNRSFGQEGLEQEQLVGPGAPPS